MTEGGGGPYPGRVTGAPPAALPRFQRLTVAGAAFAGGLVAVLLAGSGTPWLLAVLAAFAAIGAFSLALAVRRMGQEAEVHGDELARTLMAAGTDGMVIVEDGERILSANAAYLRLTRSGDTQAPLPERFLNRIPGGQEPLADLLRAIAEGGSATRGFAFDVEADGRRLQASVHGLGGSRRVLWVLSVASAQAVVAAEAAAAAPRAPGAEMRRGGDRRTGERRMEEARVESAAAALLSVWETAPVGMFLLNREHGRLANGTLADWLGYDLAEIGHGEVPFRELVAPLSMPAVVAALVQGRTDPGGIDIELIRRDGSLCPVRAWIGGRPDGACVVVATPRVPHAGVLPAPSARAGDGAAFFSRSPLAMASVGADGRIAEANGSFARLFAGGADLSGRLLQEMVAERDRAALEQVVADTFGGTAGAAPVDVSIAGEGGRSARLYAATLGTEGGRAAIYAVDTTDQRALEAQFAQSQKMQAIGQLAGGVAHDFNNVLTAIIGYCDLLLANHRPSDPSFPDIMQIKQNANRAAGLVRQLLAFSRRQTLRPQVIQLTDVISDLSMLLRRLIGETITLEVEHGRDLWPVKVDVNQFEQVAINLAVNARDAMPDGGTLTLRTANVAADQCAALGAGNIAPGDYVLVEVADTGTGIPPDIMDKIFEPFFSTKDVGKGTGLGLSTVYGIVQQTGGQIVAHSEPGRGSVFRVFLPRHVEEAGAPETETRPAEPEPRAADLTGHGSVLLVEDEDAVRAFAARALTARGYHVVAAASGAEALEAMDQADRPFDLVVSDVVMPEMDGPTLLGKLRARDPGLKVIFMSGYAEEAFAKHLPPEEAFSFLPKPFSLKQLVAAVKETIHG